jgi:hypothetical protein
MNKRYAFCNFSSISGYPHPVPSRDEWEGNLPIFRGVDWEILAEHLLDFHDYIHRLQVGHADVQIKLSRFSLEGIACDWYRSLPIASIISLADFHVSFHFFCKGIFLANLLYPECCHEFYLLNKDSKIYEEFSTVEDTSFYDQDIGDLQNEKISVDSFDIIPNAFTVLGCHEDQIIHFYVDDLIYTGNLSIDMFKSAMKKEFEMTYLGLMNYFLGIEVTQNDKGIFICQSKYARDVLKRFKMINYSSVSTPMAVGTKLSREQNEMDFDSTIFKKLVGSLMYLTTTRPDIMYGINLISRFIDTPKNSHWQAGKRLLRYIAGTMNHGILYSTSNNIQLVGYTDSDFAGSIDDIKSTSGYAFHLGTGVVAWASKKQPIMTISLAEAEYVAGTSTTCQAVSMRRILKDLMHNQEKATTIYCDNKSTIALSKNHVFHKKTKHIDTRYHFIRELVNNGELILQHCRSNEQLADIFTKALAQDQFEYLREALGIVNINRN